MTHKISFAITIIVIFLFGCNKENINLENINCTYDGKNFSLEKGFIECLYFDEDEEDKPYTYKICLTSSSISWNTNYEAFIGSGNWLCMEIETSQKGLAEGTYTCIYDMDVYFGKNGNPDNEGEDSFYGRYGNIEVSKLNEKYNFSFSFETADGKILQGEFNGKLTTIEKLEDDYSLTLTHAYLGSIQSTNLNKNTFDYQIILLSDDISYDKLTETYNGSGNWVEIFLTSEIESETLPEGTYVYSYWWYGDHNSWWCCDYAYTGNPENTDSSEEFEYSNDTITVEKNDEIYTISSKRFHYTGKIK